MSASKPIENNDLPLIDIPGYDINERIETFQQIVTEYKELLRELLNIDDTEEIVLCEIEISGKETGGYCFSGVINPSDWLKIERFMIPSKNYQESRNWEVVKTKEREVEELLGIPENLRVGYRKHLIEKKKQLRSEIIERKKQFFRHVKEYFMLKRRYVVNPRNKELLYPIAENRDKRKFYYTVGTFRESLARNKGSWWVVDKKITNAIYYVFNHHPKLINDRSGDFKFIPDTVMYVPYNETIEELIKIIGFEKLIRKDQEVFRLYNMTISKSN